MVKVVYEIARHDGGWAYRANGAWSETFPDKENAVAAARAAAAEQRLPGEPTEIAWEDEAGHWHVEQSDGHDRPETEVSD
jgi:hypothetical protein